MAGCSTDPQYMEVEERNPERKRLDPAKKTKKHRNTSKKRRDSARKHHDPASGSRDPARKHHDPASGSCDPARKHHDPASGSCDPARKHRDPASGSRERASGSHRTASGSRRSGSRRLATAYREPRDFFDEDVSNSSQEFEQLMGPGDGYEQYRRNTSDYVKENYENDPRIQERADQIRETLIKSAQIEKLSELMNIKLADCGWKSDMECILRTELQKGKKLKLEELYELVRERGKSLVPRKLQLEMIEDIKKSYKMSGGDVDESFHGPK